MAKKKKKEKELKSGEYELKQTGKPKDEKSPYVKLKLKPELKNRISKLILAEVKNSTTNEDRKAFIEHCDYTRKRYSMEDLDTDFPWENASKRRTGGTTIASDRLMPRMERALYGSGHIINITPGKDVLEDDADKQEKWLDYNLREDMKIEEKSKNILFDSIMLNFGVSKNHWQANDEQKEDIGVYQSAKELLDKFPNIFKDPLKANEIGYILKLTEFNTLEELLQTYPEVMSGNYDNLPETDVKITLREDYMDYSSGQKIEWVDPKDIIFPKGTKNAKDAWIVIQKLTMRKDELLRKKKSGFFENVDKIFVKKDKDSEDDSDYGKEYDIYEAILKYDVNDDGLEEKSVFWVATGENEKSIYLRGIKFPYDHGDNYFIIHRTSLTRYGFYTGGMSAKLKSVNESEDRRVNQISNAFDQAIVKGWIHVKTPGSPFNPRVHKYYPGCIREVADPNELTPDGMGDIPSSSMTLTEDNRRESETLSGIPTNLMSGQVTPQDPNAPAKKSEILLSESNISISAYMKNYVIGLKEEAKQTQYNNYQFRDDDKMDFRTDKGFDDISKQQIMAKGVFTCKSSLESVGSEDKARAALGLLGQLAQYPLFANNLKFQEVMFKVIITNWNEEFARQYDNMMPEGMRQLIEQQFAEAQQMAQQEEEAKKNKGKLQLPQENQIPQEPQPLNQGGQV